MLDAKVQGIKKLGFNVTAMKCYKNYSAIELDIQIRELKNLGPLPLPWTSLKLPSPKYLASFLWANDPNHAIFKKVDKNFGVEEKMVEISEA